MAKLVIVSEVVGDLVVAKKLRGFGLRASAAEPAFEAVATLMREAEHELFESEGVTGDEPWTELSEATVERKERADYPPNILIATESLFHSLTDSSDSYHIQDIGPDFLLFGTSDPKAVYHQKGTVRMPARPPLQFREDQIAAFSYTLYRYITKGIIDDSTFEI